MTDKARVSIEWLLTEHGQILNLMAILTFWVSGTKDADGTPEDLWAVFAQMAHENGAHMVTRKTKTREESEAMLSRLAQRLESLQIVNVAELVEGGKP